MTRTRLSSLTSLLLVLGFMAGGCQSRLTTPLVPPGGAPATTAATAAISEAGAKRPSESKGAGVMRVCSVPEGGLVVVDGVPVGPTPLTLNLPVNSRGYLARAVTVNVRFVAQSGEEQSTTTEVNFTPLDRLPEQLDVTANGSRRHWASSER